MEEITQYFKRKDRKTSSESSEGATPEEKRTKISEFQVKHMPTPSDMAEGVLPKLELVLDKLPVWRQKLTALTSMCAVSTLKFSSFKTR